MKIGLGETKQRKGYGLEQVWGNMTGREKAMLASMVRGLGGSK